MLSSELGDRCRENILNNKVSLNSIQLKSSHPKLLPKDWTRTLRLESAVAKVIPRVVPSVTPDEARKCFHDSREFGFGLVTIAVRVIIILISLLTLQSLA